MAQNETELAEVQRPIFGSGHGQPGRGGDDDTHLYGIPLRLLSVLQQQLNRSETSCDKLKLFFCLRPTAKLSAEGLESTI
jgi:hypothetical protein